MKTSDDIIYEQFDVILADTRHGQKTWKIKCVWSDELITDTTINCWPHDYPGAKAALRKIITKTLKEEYKKKMQLTDKIVEFYMLVNP